eukprot:TRINITY_DN15439_c0_g1_i2.p1 TRINITY_DN15439_c0_g1~~TRINITY_DN15439_c0_g1_i2.p1  ORF type:complete len:147 (+),score=27.69 TRINITY_DN15439_c0_g1_i2:98-538(+)
MCIRDSPASVQVDRDHYGAARVATVFVYLSSHSPEQGGATRFRFLNGPESSHDTEEGLRVAPVCGSAACWSNVDATSGEPDPFMVHEAEELRTPSMVSMEAALADRSLPMKIGLNLWFTDREQYPRPELGGVGQGLAYATRDVQEV